MSLKASDSTEVPADTAALTKKVFRKGNIYVTMRDCLGPIYRSQDFADLFDRRGPMAESPAVLALVVILQFAEGLSDREAADAVRARIDWKYVLGLALDDSGFDYSILSEFRSRLVDGDAARRLMDHMLARLKEQGLLKAGGRQRTDSTHVLAAVSDLNRLALVGETMRYALESVARIDPDWLSQHMDAAWPDRYDRLAVQQLPKSEAKRRQLAMTIGLDGRRLLEAVHAVDAPGYLRVIPAVEALRQIWLQQYMLQDGQLVWRRSEDLPPGAKLLCSPFDLQARHSRKRSTEWTGYKVHLSETIVADGPQLITNVHTAPATEPDVATLSVVHTALAARNLLPAEHLVDAGYMSAEQLVSSQTEHGVRLVGPMGRGNSWQEKQPDGLDHSQFQIDWAARRATCPNQKVSRGWSVSHNDYGHGVVHIVFAKEDCLACPLQPRCTHSPQRGRHLRVLAEAPYKARQAALLQQTTAEFKQQYQPRAGVEGTISQATGPLGLRRARYIGSAKVDLQHQATAAALNLLRAAAWLLETPRAKTRLSPLRALAVPT